MSMGPHLFRVYDLTSATADARTGFEAQVGARVTSGTWSAQGDPAIGERVLFLMDDVPAGIVLALDALFAGLSKAA